MQTVCVHGVEALVHTQSQFRIIPQKEHTMSVLYVARLLVQKSVTLADVANAMELVILTTNQEYQHHANAQMIILMIFCFKIWIGIKLLLGACLQEILAV